MKFRIATICTLAVLMSCCFLQAQTQVPTAAAVPQLVSYSGKATDSQGKPINGITGITFAIYKDQYEGAPLWVETQNIQPDARGN